MKSIISLVLFCLTLTTTIGANDLSGAGLAGKVHTLTVEERSFSIKFGIWEACSNLEHRHTYDADGNLIEYSIWVYDDLPSKTGREYFTNRYFHNAQGKISEYIHYTPDGLSAKRCNIYDLKGNLTEEANYKTDGSLDTKLIYIYDDNGNNTEYAFYWGDGSLQDKTIYAYDGKGNQTEIFYYRSDGLLLSKTINTYNTMGKMIESTVYNRDGLLSSKNIYTYNKKGTITESIYYKDSLLLSKIIYTYDVKGYKTEEAYYDFIEKGGKSEMVLSTTVKYRYDTMGNWVSMTRSKHGFSFGKETVEPLYEERRTFTYYP